MGPAVLTLGALCIRSNPPVEGPDLTPADLLKAVFRPGPREKAGGSLFKQPSAQAIRRSRALPAPAMMVAMISVVRYGASRIA
jgi:hypothetical protein